VLHGLYLFELISEREWRSTFVDTPITPSLCQSCENLWVVANVQPIFWRCQNFGWITLLIYFFVKKCQVGALVFFSLNLVLIFKNWCNLVLFRQVSWSGAMIFFIKIDTRIMSITPTKRTILIHNHPYSPTKRKMIKLHHFFKNRD